MQILHVPECTQRYIHSNSVSSLSFFHYLQIDCGAGVYGQECRDKIRTEAHISQDAHLIARRMANKHYRSWCSNQ